MLVHYITHPYINTYDIAFGLNTVKQYVENVLQRFYVEGKQKELKKV